jgi:hypothetical protein
MNTDGLIKPPFGTGFKVGGNMGALEGMREMVKVAKMVGAVKASSWMRSIFLPPEFNDGEAMGSMCGLFKENMAESVRTSCNERRLRMKIMSTPEDEASPQSPVKLGSLLQSVAIDLFGPKSFKK